MEIKEHEMFISELLSLCNEDDNKLMNLSCYKSKTDFIPLRISALRVLAACHYIDEKRDQIFQVLYKTLKKPNAELQETAFECIKKFMAGSQKYLDHQIVIPFLNSLSDIRNLTLNNLKMLSYLTQLFPMDFSELFCEQLLVNFKILLENLEKAGNTNGVSKKGEEEQKIVTIISIYHQIPAASPIFIKHLCQLILHTEHALVVEASSPFREVLMKFLLRYPNETLDMFMDDVHIKVW